MTNRPESTNSAGWVDAEEPVADTCARVATILAMALELHRTDLDRGERIMLGRAIELLELVGGEDDEPGDG